VVNLIKLDLCFEYVGGQQRCIILAVTQNPTRPEERMSKLLKKSQENETAAGILIDHGLYSSSVHCSYYRCVQHMLHISTTMVPQVRDDWSQGSHNDLINKVRDLIRRKDPSASLEFNNDIQRLKRMRVQADYQTVAFNAQNSREALRTSDSVVKLFNMLLK